MKGTGVLPGDPGLYLEKAVPDTLNQVPTAVGLSQHLAVK